MISTPARYRFTRDGNGGYNVGRFTDTDSAHIGTVARDGNAWIITRTARGPIESARYATRVDAVDALSVMLRRAAVLDALPTDDAPVVECPSCRYTSGHTSWCPRRHAEQPAEQTTLTIADGPADREARGECPACGEPAPHGPSTCPLGIHHEHLTGIATGRIVPEWRR